MLWTLKCFHILNSKTALKHCGVIKPQISKYKKERPWRQVSAHCSPPLYVHTLYFYISISEGKQSKLSCWNETVSEKEFLHSVRSYGGHSMHGSLFHSGPSLCCTKIPKNMLANILSFPLASIVQWATSPSFQWDPGECWALHISQCSSVISRDYRFLQFSGISPDGWWCHLCLGIAEVR